MHWLFGDDESFSYLQHRSRTSFLDPGQSVLHFGQICSSFYLVLSGTLVKITNNDDETAIVSGDCIGLVEVRMRFSH